VLYRIQGGANAIVLVVSRSGLVQNCMHSVRGGYKAVVCVPFHDFPDHLLLGLGGNADKAVISMITMTTMPRRRQAALPMNGTVRGSLMALGGRLYQDLFQQIAQKRVDLDIAIG
jgi:hypothetical protein